MIELEIDVARFARNALRKTILLERFSNIVKSKVVYVFHVCRLMSL